MTAMVHRHGGEFLARLWQIELHNLSNAVRQNFAKRRDLRLGQLTTPGGSTFGHGHHADPRGDAPSQILVVDEAAFRAELFRFVFPDFTQWGHGHAFGPLETFG